jgi:hypothetical protein
VFHRLENKATMFYYIESFHNQRRRHSALDYLSPEADEQLFCQQEQTSTRLSVHETRGGSLCCCNSMSQPRLLNRPVSNLRLRRSFIRIKALAGDVAAGN